MDEHRNEIRREIQRALQRIGDPRMGIVTSYDPNRYAAKVKVMPEGADPDQIGAVPESGWLPVSTAWTGAGWGFYCPPSPGDQVSILFLEHDPGSGIIIGRVFDINHLPLEVQSGEMWLVHKLGAFVKLTNDGKMALNSQVEIDMTGPTINITASAVINVDAPTINIAGGGPAVARVGDSVICPAGTGTITAGSGKVNSG